MTTFNTQEVLAAAGDTVAQMHELLSSLSEKQLNTVPYEKSWTAGQLTEHVSKSIQAMTSALGTKAQPADRDPGERVPQLKKIFLDFSSKLNAPDFIVPGNGPYEKRAILGLLDQSFVRLKENASRATLSELVDGLPLGPVTKLEIIHFVLYHTQRHLHQLKKIRSALQG